MIKLIVYTMVVFTVLFSIMSFDKPTTEPEQSVATPSFTPGGGTYNSLRNVSISCATSGVTIRFTTNGSDPCSNSSVYNAPIQVNASMTIKAKVNKPGFTDCIVAAATNSISNAQTLYMILI